jgi:hypothetical protein
MAITVADLTLAATQIAEFDTAAFQGAVQSHLSNLQDDAIVAEDILTLIAVVWPPAAIIAKVIQLDAMLAPLAQVSFSITPDPDPEVDAQLATGR